MQAVREYAAEVRGEGEKVMQFVDFFAGISDTQLYKQAGNGVTVNVARAIGERLKEVEKWKLKE